MMIDLLIDTNGWIYSMDKSSIFNKSAKAILINPKHNLFITTKNISEFFAVTSKNKIDQRTCFDSFNEMKSNSKTLFPSTNSLMILQKLLKQYRPIGNRVYDIEIVSIMLDNEIEHIATFNQKDYIDIGEIKII